MWRQPRWLFAFAVFVVIGFLGKCSASPGSAPPVTIVDLDLVRGTSIVLGSDATLASTPGSTLKPMVLLSALQRGVITTETRIACRGSFRLSGRNLACAHPAALGVLDAREALAYSCNRYFATVAQHMPSLALLGGLQQFGIKASGLIATPEDRALLALGLEHVALTPMQLAQAYATLARVLDSGGRAKDAVRQALVESVTYGMSHAADTEGLLLGGKTGTAHDAEPMLQHGWFAGIAFASGAEPRAIHVVVVYAPGGNGNDAAHAAHHYLQQRRW